MSLSILKLLKWPALIYVLLLPVLALGQDTVSVYFEFGSARIPEKQLRTLNSLPVNYDLSSVDSVAYLGMADSVGNIKSNLRLSEKRAKNVAKYCKGLLPENVITHITALGEKNIKQENENRRVDIVLFSAKTELTATVDSVEKDTVSNITDNIYCHYVLYDLLNDANIRTITKGKRKMVVIETRAPLPKTQKKHYSASLDKNGSITLKKVKWANKRTGKAWWAKQTSVTTIPEEDFNRFKIFVIGEPPCTDCAENFINAPRITHESECNKIDWFLMNHLQYNTTLFNKQTMIVRVPKEYVNLQADYYLSEDSENPLKWETKKGKENQNYYFLNLPVQSGRLSEIERKMPCCQKPISGGVESIIPCNTSMYGFARYPRWYELNFEAGSYYQQSSFIPYIAIGLNKANAYDQVQLLAGTDVDFGFFGAARYQYNFLSFPFFALNPFSKWKSPYQEPVMLNKYARMYIGTELKTRLNNKSNLLEQNVHLGLSWVNTSQKAFLQRVFVQYGAGIDYFNLQNSAAIYSVAQIGANVKIAWLSKKKTEDTPPKQ